MAPEFDTEPLAYSAAARPGKRGVVALASGGVLTDGELTALVDATAA